MNYTDLEYVQLLIVNSTKQLLSDKKSDNLIGHARLDQVAQTVKDWKANIDFVKICLEENNLLDFLPYIEALLD